ncbi:MAG: hypothetical protein ACK5LC_04735 [Coprobacillaceae bacterium]
MGLFDKQMKKAMENATIEQLEEMRKQGLDVEEYLQAAYQKQEEKQERLESNQIDVSKLNKYLAVPRDSETEFFSEIAGKAPMLGKDKWRDSYSNAPIVYAGVVQAAKALFAPGNATTGYVALIVLDETHGRDIEWIDQKAKEIHSVAYGTDVPKDMRKIAASIRKQEGHFTYRLPDSINEGMELWVTVTTISQSVLPNTFIPIQRIIPSLLMGDLKDNRMSDLRPIPAKYYV